MGLEEPPAKYRVETGYEADGSLVMDMERLDPMGDPLAEPENIFRHVRLDEGTFSFKGASGEALHGTAPGAGEPAERALGDNLPAAVLDGLVSKNAPDAGQAAVGVVRSFDGGTITTTAVVRRRGRTTVHERVELDDALTPITMRRTHQRQKDTGAYVLRRVEVDLSMDGDEYALDGMAVVQYDRVGYHINEAANRARGQEAWGGGVTAFGSAGFDDGLPTPENPECEIEEETGLPSDGEDLNTCGEGDGGGDICTLTPGGASILYAHGINAGGETWGGLASNNGIREYVRCDFAVGDDAAPTYGVAEGSDKGGRAHHVVQEAELRARAEPMGDDLVFVAHSQGGLISRRVAQHWEENGELSRVRGIVTIGSPHRGAYIVDGAPNAALGGLMGAAAELGSCRLFGWKCGGVRGGLEALASGVVSVVALRSDAARDLSIGSDAIREIDVPESFPTYTIQHDVSKRWIIFRLAGDLRSGSGPTYVGVADVAVGLAVGGAVVAAFFQQWGIVARLARFVYEMVMTDRWWNRISAGGERSDGIVQLPSQDYPGSRRSFSARSVRGSTGVTSHTGQTHTERSYSTLERVLADELGVDRLLN